MEPEQVELDAPVEVMPWVQLLSKGLLRRLDARQGDVVHCRLRARDPDDIPLAADIHQALTDAGRLDAFQRRAPAQRQRLLQPIEDAVKPHTRRQRIDALLWSSTSVPATVPVPEGFS